MNQFSRTVFTCLALALSLAAWAGSSPYYQREVEEEKPVWQEDKVTFPAAPTEAGQIEIYLGASAQNRFWVDRNSISVGNDGMVRYTLTVLSSGGVRASSYEGMRCETRGLRRYATLKDDGSWLKSRNESWVTINESPAFRQHAVLYLQHFCPDGALVRDSAEAVRNLLRGGRSPLDSPTQNY